MFGSKLLFFRRGLTAAVLQADGKTPVRREPFTIFKSSRSNKMSLKAMWGWDLKGRLLGLVGRKLDQAAWHQPGQNSPVFPWIKTMLQMC